MLALPEAKLFTPLLYLLFKIFPPYERRLHIARMQNFPKLKNPEQPSPKRFGCSMRLKLASLVIRSNCQMD
uniref:Uncharacterized protein n=1 Tax=Trichuris muris TaxID=70415 RepID=A0A5S6Q997_TRIMR